jgi:hypothetical protein
MLEHGFWVVAAPDQAQLERTTTGAISFSVPLRSALTAAAAHYLKKGEKLTERCEGTGISPSVAAAAPNGTLCIYTALDENKPTTGYTTTIENAEGVPGVAEQGAAVVFAPITESTENTVNVRGSWALKAP